MHCARRSGKRCVERSSNTPTADRRASGKAITLLRSGITMKRAAILLWMLFLSVPGMAATYFASPSGNGTSCSSSSPCSLAQCAASIRANGDVCSVGDGTYTNPARPATLSRNCGTGAGVCTVRATNKHGAVIELTSSGDLFVVSGNNWVIDGFKVRMQTNGASVTEVLSGVDGFTWSNNRVELKPGYGATPLFVTGTNNVKVQGNWIHTYPHCINGGQSYGAGDWGPGATAPSCGTHSRCDFDTNSADIMLITGNGTTQANHGLLLEKNDFGHRQNNVRVRNYIDITVRGNICTNATNHGCFEFSDVKDVLIENNIADIDTGALCSDEILQSGLFNSYCYQNVVVRNNTSVGHGMGWHRQLIDIEPNASADARCNDNYLPNVNGDGGSYDNIAIYNNVIYDGKSSGSAGIMLQGRYSDPSAGSCCYSNYNLFRDPAGRNVGHDSGTTYTTLAEWRSHGFGANSTDAAPQFVSYSAHNYRPSLRTAPQVDSGESSAAHPCPSIDFDGNPRSDGRCDMGAFEFQGEGGPTPTPPGDVTNVNRTDRR